MRFQHKTLALIRDTRLFLEQYQDPIYASAEDADYYRKLHKKKPPEIKIEAPPPPKPIVIDLPQPKPAPQPVAKAETPPPPPKPVVEKIDLPPPPPPTKGLKGLIARLAPDLALIDEIPSDAIAKKISNRWKTKNQTAPITVLCYQEIPEQKALLEQITKALDVTFGPARLAIAEPIEKEKQWEAFLSVPELKLIVCCDYTLWQLQGLMHYYKEVPAQGIRTLKDKPIFLLPDLSLYLKDPLLKRSLWKGLCQTLSSLPSS